MEIQSETLEKPVDVEPPVAAEPEPTEKQLFIKKLLKEQWRHYHVPSGKNCSDKDFPE